MTPIPISVFTIKDTVSIKAWEPTNVWPKLKKGLEQGIGGAKEAIQEAYAVVTSPIGEDFGPEHVFGLHHEVTDEGDVVLNKFALAKAAADLSANTSLTDDQKAAARAHLRRHYQELEEEPPASLVEGEMSILDAALGGMKPADIPLAPGVDLEAIKAGDDDPLEVVVSVPTSKSKRGWFYTGESLQDIVNFVNQHTLSGFLGHQKPDNVDTEFPTPVTHWVGAKWENGKAYFRGVVDKAAADLKRWIRSKRVTQVSIFGMPTLKNVGGEVHVVGYKPLSIDWTPLHRAGMPTEIVAVGEMDGITAGEFDVSLVGWDGSFEGLREALFGAVRTRFGNKDVHAWVHRLFADHVIVGMEPSTGPKEFAKVSYSISDGRVVLGEDVVKVVEQITYVPTGEMEAIPAPGASSMAYDGSHEGLSEALLMVLRTKFKEPENFVWVRRVYDDHCIVEIEKGGASRWFKVGYGVVDGKVVLGNDAVEVKEQIIYTPVSGEISTEGADENMTIQEMLVAIRAAVAKGETNLESIVGEMGYTKDQVVELFAGEQLKKFKTAAEYGADLAAALGFSKDTDTNEALKIAGEMAEVWKALGYDKQKPEKPAEVVGEMVKAMNEQAKAAHQKLVAETIKEKVTGEQAQLLVAKLLNVPEGAAKEQIVGEIDKILADETIKGLLGKNFIDPPAPKGGGGEGAPKHLVTKTVSI